MYRKFAFALLLAALTASDLCSEVLVYKRLLTGYEYSSLDDQASYTRYSINVSGFVVVAYNPLTGAFDDARLVKYWTLGKTKNLVSSKYVSGRAVFERTSYSKREYMIVRGFNDGNSAEAASGATVNTNIGAVGGGSNMVRISPSLRGSSVWNETSAGSNLQFAGSGSVFLTIDRKRTQNANFSGQTVDDVVNDILTFVQSKGYSFSPPIATNDTYSTIMNFPLVLDVINNDFDANGFTLDIDGMVAQPLHGTLQVFQDKTIKYTPNKDWYGDDSFTYRIVNSQGATATADVVLKVKYCQPAIRQSLLVSQDEVTLPSYTPTAGRDPRYYTWRTDDTFGVGEANTNVTNIIYLDSGIKSLVSSLKCINPDANHPSEGHHIIKQLTSVVGKSISDDGKSIVFSSESNNLLVTQEIEDTNQYSDVFLKQLPLLNLPANANVYTTVVVDGQVIPLGPFALINASDIPNSKGELYYFRNLDLPEEDWLNSDWLATVAGDPPTQTISLVDFNNGRIPDLQIDRYKASVEVWTTRVVDNDVVPYEKLGDIIVVLDVIPLDVSKISTSITALGGAANGPSWGAVVSGRVFPQRVAYYSKANNLVDHNEQPGFTDNNGLYDVFVNPAPGDTDKASVCLSKKFDEAISSDGTSVSPSISLDGNFAVFKSNAKNLTAAQSNGKWQIFLSDITDLANPITVLISRQSLDGALADDDCGVPVDPGPEINPNIDPSKSGGPYIAGPVNGQYFIVYSTSATNLDLQTPDSNGVADVYLTTYNIATRSVVSTRRVSINGSVQGNGNSIYPKCSEDGNYIVFQSDATNLVPNDRYGYTDVYMKIVSSGDLYMISKNSNGDQGNGPSSMPDISTDQNYLWVTFQSDASNLVDIGEAMDTNGVTDIYTVPWNFYKDVKEVE